MFHSEHNYLDTVHIHIELEQSSEIFPIDAPNFVKMSPRNQRRRAKKQPGNGELSRSSADTVPNAHEDMPQAIKPTTNVNSSVVTKLSQSVESIQIAPTKRYLPPRAARPLFSQHLLGIGNSQPSSINTPAAEPNIQTAPSGRANFEVSAKDAYGALKSKKKKKKNKMEAGDKESSAQKLSTRDEICVPSAASGGVPQPSHTYIAASHGLTQRLYTPQKLLVVLDLNGTLLYRPSRKNPTKFVLRPDTKLFLQRCLDSYAVVIWSSARPENVLRMCQSLGAQDMSRVIAIWGRDRFGLTLEDYNSRVQCYKRLTRLWEDPIVSQAHPEYHLGRRWDQTNTVLIDDSLEKARSEPNNLVEIPEFTGDLQEQGDILRNVDEYLQELSMTSNVSSFIRQHPFSLRLPPPQDNVF